MRFGINTFLFTSPFTNESTKLFKTFKKWGFETVEIPIEFVERREGASKMSRRIVLEALTKVARWSFRRQRLPAGPNTPISMVPVDGNHAEPYTTLTCRFSSDQSLLENGAPWMFG